MNNLNNLKKAELLEICESNNLPKNEWSNLTVPELREYILIQTSPQEKSEVKEDTPKINIEIRTNNVEPEVVEIENFEDEEDFTEFEFSHDDFDEDEIDDYEFKEDLSDYDEWEWDVKKERVSLLKRIFTKYKK